MTQDIKIIYSDIDSFHIEITTTKTVTKCIECPFIKSGRRESGMSHVGYINNVYTCTKGMFGEDSNDVFGYKGLGESSLPTKIPLNCPVTHDNVKYKGKTISEIESTLNEEQKAIFNIYKRKVHHE